MFPLMDAALQPGLMETYLRRGVLWWIRCVEIKLWFFMVFHSSLAEYIAVYFSLFFAVIYSISEVFIASAFVSKNIKFERDFPLVFIYRILQFKRHFETSKQLLFQKAANCYILIVFSIRVWEVFAFFFHEKMQYFHAWCLWLIAISIFLTQYNTVRHVNDRLLDLTLTNFHRFVLNAPVSFVLVNSHHPLVYIISILCKKEFLNSVISKRLSFHLFIRVLLNLTLIFNKLWWCWYSFFQSSHTTDNCYIKN